MVLFGLQITSSDYGLGGLVVQLVILRVWCANLAAATDILRKIHLGRRFDGFNGRRQQLLEAGWIRMLPIEDQL